MNDKFFDEISNLQYDIDKLSRICGIISVIGQWLEDNHAPDKLVSEFLDRLVILTECHNQLAEKVKTKLELIGKL